MSNSTHVEMWPILVSFQYLEPIVVFPVLLCWVNFLINLFKLCLNSFIFYMLIKGQTEQRLARFG